MKVSAKHYAVLFGASIGSLFAGSQFMHAILKPDLTIPDLTSDDATPSTKQINTTSNKNNDDNNNSE